MKKMIGAVLLMVIAGCVAAQQTTKLPEKMSPQHIRTVMTQVADWQLANPSRHHLADWTSGALFSGMAAWAQMADSDTYDKALLEVGQKNNWQPYKRIYHADDHTIGQMYIEMYRVHQDPKMLQGIKDRFDYILANPSDVTLETGKQKNKDRWWWCDALFMAPPVLAKLSSLTGDLRYLDFMNAEWKATTDYLYDTEEHLYFRDDNFFTKREANGEKIFWSRGNGWVFGGLVMVLEEMPADYPDRPYYENLYREMAAKLVKIQPEDGMWRPSLLDPASFPVPESSGTAFFCYGLAWGINYGLLDEQAYLPAVIKAWEGLNRNVQADGKLGFVQQIGHDPRMTTADQTEIYGVGAFLLAGSEVYKIAVRNGQKATLLTVTNPVLSWRDDQTVSLDWKQVAKKVPGVTQENVAVLEFKTNSLLVNQTLKLDGDTSLLFQTDLAPGQKKYFWVMQQPATLDKPEAARTTHCQFFPERKDDFGWENDKVANRIYGPALEYETITSGIDAWCKKVPYPVMDKFIKAYNEKKISYHKDHGEGGDFYKVGPTLGCGGMAPFADGKVVLPPHNFTAHKVLANGPIRSVFEVRYEAWQAGDAKVSEVKRYSIDLGSQMTRIECVYKGDAKELPVAAGIVLRDSRELWAVNNILGYWLPTDSEKGHMGCGVVFSHADAPQVTTADGHLLLALNAKKGKPVSYYAGSCWDKNEAFSSFDKWQSYLKTFKTNLDNPVRIELH
jgi:unsaturated rhamnogalacturonyl hydrolase